MLSYVRSSYSGIGVGTPEGLLSLSRFQSFTMYANKAIARILLKRLYHVAPTNDSGQGDEHRESQSKVEALYPKPFPVRSDQLNKIAGGAPAEHLVPCGHTPRICGPTDRVADLFERAGNGIFEVTEKPSTQSSGIRLLSTDEE